MLEAGLLRAFDPGAAGLAAQVTAPAPLDLFHDMRWIAVFHNSWLAFAAELVVVLIRRLLQSSQLVSEVTRWGLEATGLDAERKSGGSSR